MAASDGKSKARAKSRSGRVSLKQIAAEVGVSESFVSKVLSGRMGTSSAKAEMAAAIRAKATELGYTKNVTASALASGRHQVIAVMIHHHGTPGSGLVDNLLDSITRLTTEHGQRLALIFFGGRMEFFKQLPALDGSEVDGLLISGIAHEAILQELATDYQPRIPVITILRDTPKNPFPNLGLDESELTYLTTRHLLQQGCRRLAHISPAQDRLAGFLRAHAEAGLHIDPALILNVRGYDYALAQAAVTDALDRGLSFDGVVAAGDDQAVAAMNVLIRRGIRVPEDVKITGVDNSPVCETAYVPLTSVSQRIDVRGYFAARQLLAAIEGRETASESYAPELVIRESSARR